ncbi:MAG: YybH family protein [Gaiellaceae bacterium]
MGAEVESSTSSPADLHRLWLAAMNRGDLEGLMNLYEPEAVMVLDPAKPALEGRSAIRDALRPHVEAGATVANATSGVLVAGELAYLRSSWRLTTPTAGHEPTVIAGEGVEVARRQQDGTWLLVIDHTHGAT